MTTFILLVMWCGVALIGLANLFNALSKAEQKDQEEDRRRGLPADYYWTDDKCDCYSDRYDSDFLDDEDVVQPNNKDAGFGYLDIE
jgi:hypothetical protein